MLKGSGPDFAMQRLGFGLVAVPTWADKAQASLACKLGLGGVCAEGEAGTGLNFTPLQPALHTLHPSTRPPFRPLPSFPSPSLPSFPLPSSSPLPAPPHAAPLTSPLLPPPPLSLPLPRYPLAASTTSHYSASPAWSLSCVWAQSWWARGRSSALAPTSPRWLCTSTP